MIVVVNTDNQRTGLTFVAWVCSDVDRVGTRDHHDPGVGVRRCVIEEVTPLLVRRRVDGRAQ